MIDVLNLAIVGHTNVGKTSFLRTLTRNSRFGDVSNKPGTTRHVEGVTLSIDRQQKVVLYDTPGLEDSQALYDYIQQFVVAGERVDGIDKLQRFLSSPEAENRFEQEAKVIRQLLKCDAGLYIVDVREPILAKYHDELAILAESNRPLLAVLNFTASEESNESEWKKLLSRVGIHAIIRFDAVVPPIDGEFRLYQSLALLVEDAKSLIDHLLIAIREQEKQRVKTGDLIIAEALVDVTACFRLAKTDDNQTITSLQDVVRQREQQAIDSLLTLYQFDSRYEHTQQFPLVEGRFVSDLFNVEALKQMGIQLSKGFISGAVAGVGIDLAVGGMTLGSAALLGAAIGGLSQTLRHYGSRISRKFSGQSKLSVDDIIICFLSLRLQQLHQSLLTRSHADIQPVFLPNPEQSLWQKGKLPKSLSIARAHPEWSQLNKTVGIQVKLTDVARTELITKLAAQLGVSETQ